jgi:O-antigen/teichoic acid export membrane protein
MSKDQSSYRQIIKATSIFGGVQVFNIIIQLIRSKFIAVLLGPSGMGIIGLLTSALGLVTSITNFGLGTSAVKDVAAAHASGDVHQVSFIVSVLRKLVWITGILGVVLTLVFAPLLSKISFGNSDYTYAFMWLSISLLFTQLSSGQLVLLQGMRQFKMLAKANLYGSIVGLLITIPLYYLLGLNGIVPVIIITSIFILFFSWLYARQLGVVSKPLTFKQVTTEGKDMVKMGFLISVSGLLTVAASFLVRIFIGKFGSVEQVGLYTAGFAIITTYVGLVFNAMATEYYPRLASVADNNQKVRQTVNQQAEIAILILSPILVAFLVYINWIIIALYSTKFLAINSMIYWATLGMFFKAVCWSVGFIFLAKGESKLFFINELIVNVYLFSLNILGYFYFGLTGLGISFVLCYLIYLIQVFMICNSRFGFSFTKEFFRIFANQLVLTVLTLFLVLTTTLTIRYLFGSILFLLSTVYSLIQLEQRISFVSLIRNKFLK